MSRADTNAAQMEGIRTLWEQKCQEILVPGFFGDFLIHGRIQDGVIQLDTKITIQEESRVRICDCKKNANS